MKKIVIAGAFAGLGLLVACQPAAQRAEAPKAEKKKLSAEEKFKIALFKNQDKWQKACSNPTQLVPEGIDIDTFKKEMLATVKYPEGGVMGDWKKGEKLFGDPRKQGKSLRGNCYACHCGDPTVIACGNIGPSLRGYAKRGKDPKETYIRIYNSWAQNPCSVMPRLGYHGVLKPQEIADIVAFLHDPSSPINK